MAESIDGAVRPITQKRRNELGSLLAEGTLELHKMRIEASQVASGWRGKITKQQKYVDQLSMALKLGKEQIDTATGNFVRAPEGAEGQLDIPSPPKKGRPAAAAKDDEEEEEDDDDDENDNEAWPDGAPFDDHALVVFKEAHRPDASEIRIYMVTNAWEQNPGEDDWLCSLDQYGVPGDEAESLMTVDARHLAAATGRDFAQAGVDDPEA